MSEHTSATSRSRLSMAMEWFKTLLLMNNGVVGALLASRGHSPQGPRLVPHV